MDRIRAPPGARERPLCSLVAIGRIEYGERLHETARRIDDGLWSRRRAVSQTGLDTAGQFLLAGYENPEDLEPTDWYVSATRLQAILTALAGAIVLALEYGRGRGGEADGDEPAGGDRDKA